MAHAYPTIKEAKAALHRMGDAITQNGTPKDFGPLVYAFTGAGNVANVSTSLVIFFIVGLFTRLLRAR
jgi:hypothetical protein